MKILKQNLIPFLKKVTMTGTETITEAKLEFKPEGLKICGLSGGNTTRAEGLLHPTAFTEYQSDIVIGMQKIPEVIKILERFNKELTMTVIGNLLQVKEGSKQVEITLMDVQFIKEVASLPPLNFTEVCTISADALNTFISDAQTSKDVKITVETLPKVLVLKTDGQYKFRQEFVSEETKGGAVSTYGEPFMNAVKNLTGVLQLSYSTNYPIRIIEKTEQSIVTIMTAPQVKTE